MIEQLTNRVHQLEQMLKDYKDVMESQENKIKQVEQELEKEKE